MTIVFFQKEWEAISQMDVRRPSSLSLCSTDPELFCRAGLASLTTPWNTSQSLNITQHSQGGGDLGG